MEDWLRMAESFSVSDNFDGARRGDCTVLSGNRVELDIVRESDLVTNPSAWYAFRIEPVRAGPVVIELDYDTWPHRYVPKISMDGANWTPLDAAAVRVTDDESRAIIEIDATAKYEGEVPSEITADPAWTQQAVTAAGKGSPNEFANHLKDEHDADHVLFVIHVNKPGRSYNLVLSAGISREYWGERVVCFTRFDNQWPTPAATYAHEILHGFGAGELYFPFDETDTRERLARRGVAIGR